eukprot:409278_1
MGCICEPTDDDSIELGGAFDVVRYTNHTKQKCKYDSERPIKNCKYLKRLINGLRKFEKLNSNINDENQKHFVECCVDNYKELLSDYSHLVTKHNDDLHKINQNLITIYRFKECNVKQCSLTDRHHSNNRDEKTEYKTNDKMFEDPLINLYIETYDSLHYYLFHLFDAGLRTSIILTETDYVTDDSKCVDEKFKKMNEIIIDKKKKFNALFLQNKQSKFNLHITNDGNDVDEITFLDRILMTLCDTQNSAFIVHEEYDTDAIIQDMEDGIEFSNMNRHINAAKYTELNDLFESIKQKTFYKTLTKNSFSTGLIFYYWPYYKNKMEESEH